MSTPPATAIAQAMHPVDAQMAELSRTVSRLIDEVSKVIVGKRDVLEMVVAAALTEGAHILFEDVPGLAKSVMASTFSKAAGCTFHRIQFTPDLLPTDITGGSIFNRAENKFEFRPGPIFTNFLLADEINRASPKTQSALLEAMAEKQVSVEGSTHRLAPPFMVLATQNPIEQEGTYALPEAQLDRFALRLSVGYPTRQEESEIMMRRLQRGQDGFDTKAVVDQVTLMKMQKLIERVHVDKALVDYISHIIDLSRHSPDLAAGASPRGSLALLKLSRALAAMRGRSFVIPDDTRHLAIPVLAHRVIVKTDARVRGIHARQVIEEILKKVPVPRVNHVR